MKVLAKLWRDRRAATAVVCGFLTLPLVGVLSLAVDFGVVTMAKSQLQIAADAAALKAVTAATTAYQANPTSDYIGTGQAAGLSFFNAQLGTMIFGTAFSPSITVSSNNGTFNATVSVSGSIPTVFGVVLGFPTVSVTNNSTTTMSGNTYIALQIMLDTSNSMAILEDTINSPGALTAAIQSRIGSSAPATANALVQFSAYYGVASINNYYITPNAPPSGVCALACHDDQSTNGPGGFSNDSYGVAKANGLQMRIDVLRNAVLSIIQQLQASPAASAFQVGLYGFSTNLTTISPLSSNLSAVYSDAQSIDVTPVTPFCTQGSNPVPLCSSSSLAGGYGNGYSTDAVPQTNFEVSGAALIASTLTPTPTMDGTTPATAYRYVFLVTDGLDDYTNIANHSWQCCSSSSLFSSAMNTTNGINNGPVSGSSICDQIKATGAILVVLYTTYNPITSTHPSSDGNYQIYETYAAPYVEPTSNSAVTSALQACASPGGNYYQANSASDIQTAMNAMLLKASLGRVGLFTK